MKWEIYEQSLAADPPPAGEGWYPIGCYGDTIERDPYYEGWGVVVWARQVRDDGDDGDDGGRS